MDQKTIELLEIVYSSVGGAQARRFSNLLRAGAYGALQKETFPDPAKFRYVGAFRRAALLTELTRKLLLPGDTGNRRLAAESTFLSCEAQCAETNIRLIRYRPNRVLQDPRDVPVIDFIGRWRKEIKRVLGVCPAWVEPRFSGGSTLSDHGKFTTIPDKLRSEPTRYAGASDFFRESFQFTPLADGQPRLVTSNKFFTVPKDSLKDRGCCMEASWNIVAQLGIGNVIRKRYNKAYKVDLANLQPVHQGLAQRASVTGEWATIDLSNASDTVALELVRLLLPDDWFALLNSLRARATDLNGRRYYLAKFSSMGNGFTFELETLLFRSLIATLTPDTRASVYGDDMIVPTASAKDCIAALRFFGFTPNARKTFLEGPFRESCGGDFFQGHPVRAPYLKSLPIEPQHWVALANQLRRWDPDLRTLRRAWQFCRDQVPVDWRNDGPAHLGDLVFWNDAAKPTWRKLSPPDRKVVYVKASYFAGHVNPELKSVSLLARKVRLEKDDYLTPCWRVKRPVSATFPLGKFGLRIACAAASLGVPSSVTFREGVTGYRDDWVVAWGTDLPDSFLAEGISLLADRGTKEHGPLLW